MQAKGWGTLRIWAPKATTPLKPTAGFHPSEPSLAGDPGLNGAPGSLPHIGSANVCHQRLRIRQVLEFLRGGLSVCRSEGHLLIEFRFGLIRSTQKLEAAAE